MTRTQPEALRTTSYVCGVDTVDGHTGWCLFEASREGDVALVESLLDDEPLLVNVEYWYEQPIHFAVRASQAAVVECLLERGAEPGQTRFLYDGWEQLVDWARERGDAVTHGLLSSALGECYGYTPGFDELLDPVQRRDLVGLRATLDAEPRLAHAADIHGHTLAHWAVLSRNLDLLDLAVELDIDLERKRVDGQTAAHVSLNGDYRYRRRFFGETPLGPLEMAKALVERGATYDLSMACAAGDLSRVSESLAGAESAASALDSGRRSPLMYAARAGHAEVVAQLLESGAAPNLPEECAPRGAALFEAAAGNHLDVARLLLDAGADPNADYDSSGCCVTIARHRHGDGAHEMVGLLRSHGARTPIWELDALELAHAVSAGDRFVLDDPTLVPEVLARNDIELVQLLFDSAPERLERLHGGILRCPDPDARLRSTAMTERLLDLGWDPERASWVGLTPLHHFAGNGDLENVALLIERGVSLDPIDDRLNGTPLAHASRSDHLDVVDRLLAAGANPKLPVEHDWAQPLNRASAAGHAAIVERLRAT